MATPAEPATSAIFRALRSVDVDPDLAYEAAEESRRQAGEKSVLAVKGRFRRFAPWTAPGRSGETRCSRGKRGDAPLCGIAGNKLLAANVLDHTVHSSGEDSQNRF